MPYLHGTSMPPNHTDRSAPALPWRARTFLALGLAWVAGVQAEGPTLRYGVVDSMGYPLVVTKGQGAITSGVLHDLGQAMARQLGAEWVLMPVARRRVEPYLLQSRVDLICYLSPQWTGLGDQVQWSIAHLPQVERLVSLKATPVVADAVNSVSGRKVSTQLGYAYPSIQALFESKQSVRVDEARIDLMFKAVEIGRSDLLISSEAEISAFFANNPSKKNLFQVSKVPFSITPTQCAIAPQSGFSKSQIDLALGELLRSGAIKGIAKRYGMSAE